MNTTSLNNRLVLEVYVKTDIRLNTKSGFGMIDQKSRSKGLRVLMDAKLADGSVIPKGSTAFIKEQTLHTASWATTALECDFLPTPFILVSISEVDFIAPPSEGEAA